MTLADVLFVCSSKNIASGVHVPAVQLTKNASVRAGGVDGPGAVAVGGLYLEQAHAGVAHEETKLPAERVRFSAVSPTEENTNTRS